MSNSLPRITVVTPSYNQAQFLETTIRSILDQNYPNLEYIIMDGGSTDGSIEIIKRYQDRLAYWQSEKDRGQNHAITEGFKHATGDIFAYLNSDDVYLPWTFATVSEIISQLPDIEWLTTRTTMVVDAQGDPVMTNSAIEHTRIRFYSGFTLGNLYGESGWIQQEGTFWRPSLWQRAGACMDEGAYRTGDFELWSRFFQHALLTTTYVPLAAFRWHGGNKTQLDLTLRESQKILERYPQEKKYSWRQYTWLKRIRTRLSTHSGKYVTRFDRRFGAPAQWVQYDFRAGTWSIHPHYII